MGNLSIVSNIAYAMEIVNNQLYLLDESKFFIVDIKINSIIQSWNLPKENNKSVGGLHLKLQPFYSFLESLIRIIFVETLLDLWNYRS